MTEDNLDETRETEIIPDLKSKSQIKREHLALQGLGKQLVAQSVKQLEKLGLTEKLLQEIMAAKKFKKAALKRQLQYIGALLDSEDVDPDKIEDSLNNSLKPNKEDTQKLHRAEEFRDRLINGDQTLLKELTELYSGLDFQQLRQLIRNAQKERSLNQPPRSQRKLYRLLRELMD